MQAAMSLLLTKQVAVEQQSTVGAAGKKVLRLQPASVPAPGAGQFAVLQEAFEAQDLQDD
jgi:hypothetical protein